MPPHTEELASPQGVGWVERASLLPLQGRGGRSGAPRPAFSWTWLRATLCGWHLSGGPWRGSPGG
eukprot:3609104-Alexandrium_andersonii.AAC.1